MKSWSRLLSICLLAALLGLPAYSFGGTLRLATGSPYELGLVDALFAEFKKEVPCDLNVTKAGSGESLQMLKTGAVDVIMVHAPAEEAEAIKEGWALNRTYFGGNDFVIVGPVKDPAGIKGCKDVVGAYRKIAGVKAPFISRGDNSGTHKKELTIWEKTGITPQGTWYMINKDFMMSTLLKASDDGAYFMTDRSTWIVAKKEKSDLKLVVLFEGDPLLINQYHALTINPKLFTDAHYELAKKFVDFLKSEQGQKIIAAFGKEKFGEPLYFSVSQKPEK